MKCYYHHDIDAVGLCKSCSKGICPQCATDVGGGLACTETCIEEVKTLNTAIKSNTSATAVNQRAAYIWPAFLIILGVLFLLIPILSGYRFGWSNILNGGFFIIFGLILGGYQRTWKKAIK